MTRGPSTPDFTNEPCQACDRETKHAVWVEIRTESEASENAEFSREPYRVAVCTECGTEQTARMNNA